MLESDVHVPSNADWPRARPVPLTAPLHWLGRGFADLLTAPVASLFYGVLLALMGFLLTRYYGGAVGLALTTGFLRIVVLCVAGFVTWFVGLAFTVPLIGHATRHAYRDCVEPLSDTA